MDISLSKLKGYGFYPVAKPSGIAALIKSLYDFINDIDMMDVPCQGPKTLSASIIFSLDQLPVLVKKNGGIVVSGNDEPDFLSGFHEIVKYGI